jgi:hypothetical protein
MKPSHRSELRYIISQVFNNGANKKQMFLAIQSFIDRVYPAMDPLTEIKSGSNRPSPSEQSKILKELCIDIHKCGGLSEWKQNIKDNGKRNFY